MYSEELVQTALAEETTEIKVNRKPINNLRFADDTLLLAESFEDLQHLTNRTMEASEEFGLTINASKTRFFVIPTTQQQDNLMINGEAVQKVHKYKYKSPRTIGDENNDCTDEIKVKPEMYSIT